MPKKIATVHFLKASLLEKLKEKTKAFSYLVGQVMKKTKGKTSPPLVNELLKKHLENKG